jgi:hypothetical protein
MAKIEAGYSNSAKKAVATKPAKAVGEEKENRQVNVRQIKNGFLVRTSYQHPTKGYVEEEEYCEENPIKGKE